MSKHEDRPNLFKTQKEQSYPIMMIGLWMDKYKAYALVDTPEHQEELKQAGYRVMDK